MSKAAHREKIDYDAPEGGPQKAKVVLAVDPPQGLAELALNGTLLNTWVKDTPGALDRLLRTLVTSADREVVAMAYEEQCMRSQGNNIFRKAADRKAMHAEGVIRAVAEIFDIRLIPITAKGWKAHLVGHSGAKDKEIKDAVEKQFGVRPKTQHETEAIAVGHELLRRLQKGRARR